MSHEFESGFYGSGKPAWHGLGTVIEGRATVEEALDLAGLRWRVEKRPLMVQSFDGELDPVNSHFAVQRDMDHSVLGIVSPDYEILQNDEAFSFFNKIVSDKEAIIETAGSLKGGRVIWALAKMPGEILVKGKDITNKYVLLATSHDGSVSYSLKLTPIRVECSNLLTMALKGGAYKIRHTKNMVDQIEIAAEAMGFANKMYDELNDIYNTMAKKKMNHDETIAYFKRCLKKSEHSKKQEMSDLEFLDNNESEEKDSRALTKVVQIHEEGMIKEIGTGNLFSAYNTMVEYVDHHRRVNGPEELKAEGRFFNAAFGGSGLILKTKAYQEAAKLLKV